MESVRRHLGGGPGPVPYPYGAGTVAAAPSHRLSERPMFNRRHEMYELPPVRTIAGPKRFVCDEPSCGRAFSKKWNLTAHRRIHTGYRPFVCDCCNESFRWLSSLKAHCRKGCRVRGGSPISGPAVALAVPSVRPSPPAFIPSPWTGVAALPGATDAAVASGENVDAGRGYPSRTNSSCSVLTRPAAGDGWSPPQRPAAGVSDDYGRAAPVRRLPQLIEPVRFPHTPAGGRYALDGSGPDAGGARQGLPPTLGEEGGRHAPHGLYRLPPAPLAAPPRSEWRGDGPRPLVSVAASAPQPGVRDVCHEALRSMRRPQPPLRPPVEAGGAGAPRKHGVVPLYWT